MLRFLPPSQHPNSSYPLLHTRSSQRVARLSSVQLAFAAVAMRVTERQLTLAALPQLPTITHNLNQWKQLHLKLWRHFQSASEASVSCTNHCIRDARSHSTRNRTGPTGDFHVAIKSHHRNRLVQRQRIRLLATFRGFFFLSVFVVLLQQGHSSLNIIVLMIATETCGKWRTSTALCNQT